MVQILGTPKSQFFKTSTPSFLAGGKVYTYEAGTSTPKATYPTKDDADAETNPNDNPIVLDSRGEADIFSKGPTKITLTDSGDNEIWSVDDLDSASENILDSAGNELLTFTQVANAVNDLQFINSATGDPIKIKAIGNDTNIGVDFGDMNISRGTLNVDSIEINSGDLNINSGNASAADVTVGGSITASGGISLLPTGSFLWYTGVSAPDGWLECTGTAISRNTYGSLFNKIGTTFGVGDGSTTFNLPNQERRVLVGKGGSGRGTLGNSVGDTGGEESHELTEAELAAHTHSYDVQNAFTSSARPTGSSANHSGGFTYTNDSTTTGSGDAYNIMQPSLVMMLIIKE